MALQELKEKLEKDLQELQVYLVQAEGNEKRQVSLTEEEHRVRKMQKDHEEKVLSFEKKEADFKSQQEFAEKSSALAVEEKAQSVRDKQLNTEKEKELKGKEGELEGFRKELEAEKLTIEEQKKLLPVKAEIDKDRVLLSQEREATHKLKEQLDQQAKEQQFERERLQKLAIKFK